MLVAIDCPVPLAVHFAWNNAFRKLDDPAERKSLEVVRDG
jgi:hypothetical protein